MNVERETSEADAASNDRSQITGGLARAVGNAVRTWWHDHGYPPAILETDTGDVLLLSGQCVASHMGDGWRVGNWFPYGEIHAMRKVTDPTAILPWLRDMQSSFAATRAAGAAIAAAARR